MITLLRGEDMEGRKKQERGDADTHKRREKGEKTGKESEDRESRRANIAGENYLPPEKASPAYAPGDEASKASCRRENGETPCNEAEVRTVRRANLAGERYDMPAETREPQKQDKKE